MYPYIIIDQKLKYPYKKYSFVKLFPSWFSPSNVGYLLNLQQFIMFKFLIIIT